MSLAPGTVCIRHGAISLEIADLGVFVMGDLVLERKGR